MLASPPYSSGGTVYIFLFFLLFLSFSFIGPRCWPQIGPGTGFLCFSAGPGTGKEAPVLAFYVSLLAPVLANGQEAPVLAFYALLP